MTGMGMISPAGNSVESSWDAVCNGRSGIGPIESFDASEFSTRFGGMVKDFDCGEYLSPRDARRMDVFVHYGIAAGVQAMNDSGLMDSAWRPERAGAAIGSGIGGIVAIENTALQIRDAGPRKISPFFVPGSIINMISGNLSMRYGLQGPNIAVVTACATGTHNIGLAAQMISIGQAEVMLTGGAEMATCPVGLGGFCAARALSTRNEDPQRASRPWDRERDGFVLGDGAGMLVLEELEHARSRGAPIHAELTGFGMSGDAHHATAPAPGGRGAAACMRAALRDAGLNPDQVDHVNAHGTSTPAGDLAETQAIKTVFGEHARALAVSSNKSMIGHLLGAAGSVEAIFSILAIRDGIVPPTINLDEPDQDCDLDYVPHVGREREIRVVLSNSFGFGGTNGSLILARFDG